MVRDGILSITNYTDNNYLLFLNIKQSILEKIEKLPIA